MNNNPAFARTYRKSSNVLYHFFMRLNTACIAQRMRAIPAPRRYATVTITPLNGGTGAIHKNFATRQEFEFAYRAQTRGFVNVQVPTCGVGGIGDSIFNWSWKIFGEVR